MPNDAYNFLIEREFEVVFDWIDKNSDGEINDEKEEIIINLDRLVAKVFLHEYMHHSHPEEDDEDKIEKMACDRLNRMGVEEIKSMAKKLMQMWAVQFFKENKKKKKE